MCMIEVFALQHVLCNEQGQELSPSTQLFDNVVAAVSFALTGLATAASLLPLERVSRDHHDLRRVQVTNLTVDDAGSQSPDDDDGTMTPMFPPCCAQNLVSKRVRTIFSPI
jgi:hypothetical protein